MWKSFASAVALAAFVMLCIGVVGQWRAERDRIDAEYHAAVTRIQAEHRKRLAQIERDFYADPTQAKAADMMTRNVEKLVAAALREIEIARTSITSTGCNKPAMVVRAIGATLEFDGTFDGGALDSRVQTAIAAHAHGVVVKTENISYINNVLTITMSLTFPLSGQ